MPTVPLSFSERLRMSPGEIAAVFNGSVYNTGSNYQSPKCYGCGGAMTYYADSDAEAAGCAANQGFGVVSGSFALFSYQECIIGSFQSPTDTQELAYTAQDALSCAQSHHWDSTVVAGFCQ